MNIADMPVMGRWQEQILEQGFAIFPDAFTSKEIETFKTDLKLTPLRRSRAGVRNALAYPAVAAFANKAPLLAIARAILGSAAIPFRATLFEKSADANWLVVWHQDTALPIREKRDDSGWGPWSVKNGVMYAHAPAGALSHILALRVHLDDSTAQNGPLRVLPATHLHGVLNDDQIHEFAAGIAAIDCTASQGAIVAMRPLLIHSSSKSQSDAPRCVLHVEYAPSLVIAEGFELAIA